VWVWVLVVVVVVVVVVWVVVVVVVVGVGGVLCDGTLGLVHILGFVLVTELRRYQTSDHGSLAIVAML
jgi:hypothetical protein